MSKKTTSQNAASPVRRAVYWNLPTDLYEWICAVAKAEFPNVGGKQNQVGVILLQEARKARERKEKKNESN